MLVAELGMLKEVVGGVSRQLDPLRTFKLRLKAAQSDQMIAIHCTSNTVKALNVGCTAIITITVGWKRMTHIGRIQRNLGHNN